MKADYKSKIKDDLIIPIVIPTYEPTEEFIEYVRELATISSAIVIVDDGSGEDYRYIFEIVDDIPGVSIIKHVLNLGKGRSLKDAFNYIMDRYPESLGLVTADSDGQHTINDIRRVLTELRENPSDLILGCRNFKSKDIPWKSRVGNSLTRRVCAYLCGINVSDTQTGLRGIPLSFVKILMYTPGERFEYETNVLLECNNCISIREVPIATIYDSSENHKTHFDPLIDSINIYKVILAYSLSSMVATIVDFAIFSVTIWIGYSVWFATAVARAIASFVSFLINRNVVFKSKGDAFKQLLKYFLLVIVSGSLSAFLISRISLIIHINLIFIKIIVETLLFFFNYYIQRTYIFVKRKGNEIEKSVFSDEITENTDWTKYYQGKKSWISTLTQRYTLERIITAIDKYVVNNDEKLDICEMGGGNSCFCEKICEAEPIHIYNIIDSNPLAVRLFNRLEMKSDYHKGICRDLLNDGEPVNADYHFVFSIGLIEHFRGEDIRTMIKRHFEYCEDGGIVFISFPTPTRKYLFFRKCMEFIGVWQFHDEKPIRYEEVSDWFEEQGKVLEHYVNRKLPLTQEVVISKKGGKA